MRWCSAISSFGIIEAIQSNGVDLNFKILDLMDALQGLVTIAGSMVGSPWIGALINVGMIIGMDAIATAADVETGYRSADDAWAQFGVNTLVNVARSVITMGVSIGAKSAGDLISNTMKNSVGGSILSGVTKAAITGTGSLVTQVAGKYLGSGLRSTFDGSKDFMYGVRKQYERDIRDYGGILSTGQLVDFGSRLAERVVSGGLHSITMGDLSGIRGTLSTIAGDFTRNGVAYASNRLMSGVTKKHGWTHYEGLRMKFNILNTADFGARTSVGLLKYEIGGTNSLEVGVGSGGTTIGAKQHKEHDNGWKNLQTSIPPMEP